MSTFAIDVYSSEGDKIAALNYVLSNLGQTGINGGQYGNVLIGNSVTGQITGVSTTGQNLGTISYLYNYINVKYATSPTGSTGFSSNSSGATYFGIRNTVDGTISSNPTSYNWTQVAGGGFGTTKGLYYTTNGGNQIFFSVGTTPPNVRYQPVLDDTAILLQTLANSIVQTNNIQPGAVTNVAIAANTIQSTNIQDGAVTALQIANRTLTQAQIALGSITGNTIMSQTLTGTLIALNTITGNLVAQNTITGNLVVPGTITGNLIAANTITANNIEVGTITANLLSANLIIAKDVVSTTATLGDFNSAGYWLQANTGSARFGGTMSIGNNLTVGNNAVVGASMAIGNNLSVGNNAIIGASLAIGANAIIGDNASVGNNVVIGNSLGVGNNAVIGNNLTVGNNAVIGGNLLVAGLITSGNLNTNTVNTTTITANAVTLSNAVSDTVGGSQSSPTVSFAGNSSPYAFYSTGAVLPRGLNVDINTANVSVVINGVVDVFGWVTANVNYVTQMYAQLFRYGPGNAVVALTSSFATTPAAIPFAANATVQATETLLPYRLVAAGILDNFTSNGVPQTVTYKWLIGTYTGAFTYPANVFVPNISYTTATISATNFKR